MPSTKQASPARKAAAKAPTRATTKTRPVPKKAASAQQAAQGKPEARSTKTKLVRDSFTIPKDEYAALQALKERALALSRPTKKSEVLRAGINALTAMSDKSFLAVIKAVPSLKTGRPKARG